ncbi:MAG: hypothetical protein COB15_15015 [Flavobacteriales bacterium]|nr:MAG: hypothetical protein COB15_15015 [Flavobacteriales bacterium]
MPFFKDNTIPNSWFIIIFGIKIIVSILLTAIYSEYYDNRDKSDIFKYFDDSMAIFEAIKTNPIDYIKMILGLDFDHKYFTVNYYQYMYHWTRPYSSDLISDSHIIIRFNAFVRLFSFGHFQVHNVFINFVSLIGLTAFYKAFKPFLANKEKVLFYAVFLLPSILFWGSGLLKESIIFFALGLLICHFFKITKQFTVLHLLITLTCIMLLIYTKLYLLVALSIPMLGYLINRYLNFKKPAYGYIISTSLFIIAVNVSPLIVPQLNFITQISNKQQAFSKYISSVPTNSGFLIPELTNGVSILLAIPNALLNTVIRPFLWECNSIFVYFSALENIIILCCIVIAFVFRKKMNEIQKNIFYFNTIFVFVLFCIIGLTTPVFGAIMRYKIPGLILLLISLLLLVDLDKIKDKHPFLKKIL